MPKSVQRTRLAIAKKLADELRDLKGKGLLTPGYWVQENGDSLLALLDSIATPEARDG